MSTHKLIVCKSCHRSSEELAEGQISDGSRLIEQLNALSETLCSEQLQSELLEIESAECLWACSRGCVVAVSNAKKPTYLFADISPEENANTALLDFMELYIKSRKGNIAWKKFPELLQNAIVAQIPPVTAD
jgi:predicted metal-binding protein